MIHNLSGLSCVIDRRQRKGRSMNFRMLPVTLSIWLLGPSLTAHAAAREPCIPPAGTSSIEFRSAGNTLRGFIDLPAWRAKHPAILMVLGGGDSDVTVDDYLVEVRKAFRQAGIATLLWDKAGNGCSSGKYSSALPIQERATETLAALDMLKQRDDIDARRIGVWGFSQGGWVAPMAAVRSKDIAYLILVNGAGKDALSQGAYLSVGLLRAAGVNEAEATQAYATLRRSLAVLRAGGTAEDSLAVAKDLQKYPALRPTFRLDEAGAGELQSLLARPEWSYTAEEFLQQVNLPTLAIFGKRDTIVDGSESADVYRRAFERAGNRDLTIEFFDDADHYMFQPEQQGQKRFARGYIHTMIEWLEDRRFTQTGAAGDGRAGASAQ